MIKKTLLTIGLVLCVLIVNGQSKMSPYTHSYLRNHSIEKEAKSTKDKKKSLYVKSSIKESTEFVDAFVEMNEGASAEVLVAEGAIIATRIGDILTVQIPVNKIVTVSELETVKKISVAKPVRLKNDKSRTSTKAATLHAGTGFKQSYTGTGVVVGVVDSGMDFNHIAFADQNNKTRIKRVYLPSVRTGTPPTGKGSDGKSFPGSEYTTPEQIAKLTTDTRTESHGTHTSSIAAGGYRGNGYYGNAPDADLVMVGSEDLTDVNIANGVIYAFNYANSVGKPAVVNLSLGSNLGPRDGTSALPQYLDGIVGNGNVVVLSAGNEGADQLYINKTFASTTDELKTFLIDYQDGSRYIYANVDCWSRTSTPVGVKVAVYSTSTNAIVYQSAEFKPSSVGSSFTISSSADSNFAKYYTGSVYFFSGLEDNGRYNVWCEVDAHIPTYQTSTAQPKYRLGLIYTSAAQNEIDVWADDYNTFLSGESKSGWTNGNSQCSINDFATGDNTISVGAYSSRVNFIAINGQTYGYDGTVLNDIANFSSYGVDFRGISRPDVTAPGFFIISAVNSYDSETVSTNHNYLAAEITSGGRKHQWGDMAGTSMSSPTVAGIVALWLQADPSLNAADIKNILRETSVKDSYVTRGNAVRWGAGKIDANAGLISILKSGVEGVVTENNTVIIYPNPSDGQFTIFAQGETGNVTLNLYTTNGALATTKTLDASHGEINVDLSGELSSGLYIVQLIGEKVNYTSRLIIK